jgi:hypothetical protein
VKPKKRARVSFILIHFSSLHDRITSTMMPSSFTTITACLLTFLFTSIHAGPHSVVATSSPQQRFLAELLDELWFQYRDRVSYARECEGLLGRQGDNLLVNDHIAFRSFHGGIHSLSRIFEALGYEASGCYNFVDKHLTAIHYEHRTNPLLPKLFISELKVFELEEEARLIVEDVIESHRPHLSTEFLAQLRENPTQELIATLAKHFEALPWKLPTKEQVETLNRHSQYAAWVLVHGYRVNHFTALISPPDTLDAVLEKLKSAGIPMKANIEGAVGTKLRQTSTKAVPSQVDIMGNDGVSTTMLWSYAYMEFAERNPLHGKRFEGFLGPQATELFEMTATEEL